MSDVYKDISRVFVKDRKACDAAINAILLKNMFFTDIENLYEFESESDIKKLKSSGYIKGKKVIFPKGTRVKLTISRYVTEMKLPNGVELEVGYLQEGVDYKLL